MSYRNPTLTEIYSEFYLAPGTLPEKSFMALASELAKKGLSNLEFTQGTFVLGLEKENAQEGKIVPRIRCWDTDRTRVVQFSPNQYYVNLLGEYPGWDAFTEHLRAARESLVNVLKTPVSFTYASLATIDKWKAQRDGFAIGQYLNCDGRIVPKWYADVAVSSDIPWVRDFLLQMALTRRYA